jgi:hypothetical protein
MSKLEIDLEEIEGFLKGFKVSTPNISNKIYAAKVKSSYKQFHALLVWGLVSERSDDRKSDKGLYFKECLSDISHAYFLNLCSLYKSSRSSLRSGIENAIRVSLLEKEVDITKIVSVFDLFGAAKSLYKADSVVHGLIVRLSTIYGELCKSVHSSSTDYLSLSVPFEQLSDFNEEQFLAENERLRDVCSIVNQCAFWWWDSKLPTAGHSNEDMVRDAVPRAVKRAKTS